MSNISAIEFLQALYPEPLPARLVIWTRSNRGGKLFFDWGRSLDRAARLADRYRATREVFFNVALHDPEVALRIVRRRRPRANMGSVRGCEDSAVLMPALWVDIDVAGPHHRRDDLPPDRDSALGLLQAIPRRPSIIVHTGGGYHVYWLLREPLILTSEEERRTAKGLVRKVQAALQETARGHGWWVDPTASLAQALRLPGTLNHKTPGGLPVTVEQFPLVGAEDCRYAPEDFDALPAPPEEAAAEPPWTEKDVRDGDADPVDAGPPADFRRIYRGCQWMRHCYRDRRRLREPEWFAALTIVARSAVDSSGGPVDGRRLAHRMSRGHPGYSPAATDDKFDNALRTKGPRTCDKIAHVLGAHDAFCGGCAHFGQIKSPIVLGRPGTSAGNGAAAPAAGGDGPTPGGEARRRRQRPRIVLSHREHEVNDQALAALAAHEENLFERGGALVQVLHRPSAAKAGGTPALPADASPVRHVAGSPMAKQIVEARLRELLSRHCDFVIATKAKDGGVRRRPAHPPRWAARALLSRGVWPQLPVLEGLVESPVLRHDGSVLQAAGYDAASGLYCLPSEEFDPVPEQPTRTEVEAALALLREVVCDFPFKSEAHFAAWLSALLTPLARAAFDGPSPLNLIDANVPAAGKSLLGDVCSMVVTGRPAPRMSYSRDDDEIRKSITGLALEATQMVLVDNVAGVFGSPTIDRALTADTWRDRLLGSNEQVAIPLRVTWYVTGNNVELKGDTVRRCLHIRLESPEERPEERTEFRHPRLLSWIGERRRTILPAALTLLRGYEADGRPPQELPGLGSYESWSDRVRATVVWLGLADPAETRGGLATAADTVTATLGDLVAGLEDVLGGLGGAATAREILVALDRRPDQHEILRSALEELFPRLKKGELPTAVKLTFKLRAYRGRLVDGACIEQGQKTRRGLLWTVRRVR